MTLFRRKWAARGAKSIGTNGDASTSVVGGTRPDTAATVRARENSTGSSNRLRKLSAARLSVSLAADCAEVATACGWLRSRFICAMRMVYMRTKTTMVRSTTAKAGRKMARGMGVPGWLDRSEEHRSEIQSIMRTSYEDRWS